ncbi:hypothetical protein [Dipodfec virus UOA04_Rod_724]|nr:hypothetical protein [Dipodfec virus UOA04_Rod_724]
MFNKNKTTDLKYAKMTEIIEEIQNRFKFHQNEESKIIITKNSYKITIKGGQKE